MNYELFNMLILLAIVLLSIINIVTNAMFKHRMTQLEIELHLVNTALNDALAIAIVNNVKKD